MSIPFVRPCLRPWRQSESILSLCSWCNYFYCLLLTCHHVWSHHCCVQFITLPQWRGFSWDFICHTNTQSEHNRRNQIHTHLSAVVSAIKTNTVNGVGRLIWKPCTGLRCKRWKAAALWSSSVLWSDSFWIHFCIPFYMYLSVLILQDLDCL